LMGQIGYSKEVGRGSYPPQTHLHYTKCSTPPHGPLYQSLLIVMQAKTIVSRPIKTKTSAFKTKTEDKTAQRRLKTKTKNRELQHRL